MEHRMPLDWNKTVEEWAEEVGVAKGDIILTQYGKYQVVEEASNALVVETLEGEHHSVFYYEHRCAFYAI